MRYLAATLLALISAQAWANELDSLLMVECLVSSADSSVGMTALGQTKKTSQRAYAFCSCANNGHRGLG